MGLNFDPTGNDASHPQGLAHSDNPLMKTKIAAARLAASRPSRTGGLTCIKNGAPEIRGAVVSVQP